MKRLLSFLIILALAYQCMASFGVFVWFESNRSLIAEKFCENKENTLVICGGQCVLIKKLKALDNESTEKNIPQNSKYEAFFCLIQSSFKLPEEVYFSVERNYAAFYSANYSFIHLKNNFRPPRFNA